MKSRNLFRIIIGALMLISGIVSILLTGNGAIVGVILLFPGCAFLITGITRHRREGDGPESDERSKKIAAYGLSWAWLTGLFFMFGLIWLDYLNVFKFSAQNALALSIIVLALSAVIYPTFLLRKGDVGQ
jgi:predicted membrane protein